MKHLKKHISDKKKRHNHIIENMIYMAEIQDSNIDILKNMFGNNSFKSGQNSNRDGRSQNSSRSRSRLVSNPRGSKLIKEGSKNRESILQIVADMGSTRNVNEAYQNPNESIETGTVFETNPNKHKMAEIQNLDNIIFDKKCQIENINPKYGGSIVIDPS